METKDFLEFGPFRTDLVRRVLMRDGQVIPLPGKAFDVLVVLLQRQGETVSKDEMMKAVWPDTFVEEGNLTQTIFVLRKALGEADDGQSLIVTIPRQGYRFVGAARVGANSETAAKGIIPATVSPSGRPWFWVLAGILAVAALGAWWYARHPPSPVTSPPQLMRLSVDLGPDALESADATAAISPDGTRIVFRIRGAGGKAMLAVRPMDLSAITPLPGTVGAIDPFFSPDGQWVAFWADGKLKKTSIHGGAPITVCDSPDSFGGGSWSEDNHIIAVLGIPFGLSRIDAGGGTPQLLAKPADHKQEIFRAPQILPGGEAVVYTANNAHTNYDEASIEVLTWKTGRWKTLVRGGYHGRYLPGGYLVWVSHRTLFGARFDPVRLEVKGTPVPLIEDDVAGNASIGNGQFDFSRNGTFVYLAGELLEGSVVWMDSAGNTQPLMAKPGHYHHPRLSPDGKQLALAIGLGHTDIYIYDLKSGALSRRSFLKESSGRPHWSRDGKHIAFLSTGPGAGAIWWMRADGTGEPQLLYTAPRNIDRFVLSPDDRTLIVAPMAKEIWTLPLDMSDPDRPKPGKPELFLRRILPGFTAAFSPDGRWIAYSSHDPGDTGIYVRPAAPERREKWQISFGEAKYPVWSRSANQILYEDLDGYIHVVDYALSGDSFSAGKPRLWLDRRISAGGGQFFDLAPDGKRIVALPSNNTGNRTVNLHLTFLVNFFDELRRRLPASN